MGVEVSVVAAFLAGVLSVSSPCVLPLVTGVGGGMLVAIGAIMTLGIYQQFFAWLVALSPWTPWEPEL